MLVRLSCEGSFEFLHLTIEFCRKTGLIFQILNHHIKVIYSVPTSLDLHWKSSKEMEVPSYLCWRYSSSFIPLISSWTVPLILILDWSLWPFLILLWKCTYYRLRNEFIKQIKSGFWMIVKGQVVIEKSIHTITPLQTPQK